MALLEDVRETPGTAGKEAPTDGLTGAPLVFAVVAVLLGTFMSNLDAAIANIAMPVISHELNSPAATTVWVVNAYQLAMGVCVLLLAALGDRWGYRRIHLTGVTIFLIGSIACAMSPSIGVLIASRTFQGIGGALLAVAGPALLRVVAPHRLLSRCMGWLALSVALSASVGPSLAALIMEHANWRWLFWVNLPASACVLVAAAVALPRSAGLVRPFDKVGSTLGVLALALVIVGVANLGGVGSRIGEAELAGGLAIGAVFAWQQRGRAHTVLPNDLLAIPLFSMSVVTAICAYAAQMLALVSLPFVLEQTYGRSVAQSGLLMTPWPFVIVFVAPLAGRLATRYPAGILSSIGLAVLACGLALTAALPHDAGNVDIALRLALCGIGFGLYQTPNNVLMMTSGPRNRSGAAGAMMSLSRIVGMSLGAACAALLLSHGASLVPLGAAAAVALAGACVSSLRLTQRG